MTEVKTMIEGEKDQTKNYLCCRLVVLMPSVIMLERHGGTGEGDSLLCLL